MRGMLKLLIADGTEAFRLALAENLKEHYTVRVCQEGHETLKMMLLSVTRIGALAIRFAML